MKKKQPLQRTEDDPMDERLLSAAVEVFLEKGFAATSLDEIAARAKASKITFYNRYGNKEALFEAIVRRQNAAVIESMSGNTPEGMPIDEFLRAFAERIYGALLNKDTVKLVRVLQAETYRFPQLANIFNDSGPGRGAKLLAAALETYMARNILRQADPAIAAEQFFHLSIGEVARRNLLGLRPALTKAEVSKRIAAGIDVFLRAYSV